MFSLRRVNPMARAVGTMGAVAALVGGVTFAQLQSNTVTLQNNTLASATAALQIGLTQTCSDAGNGPVNGMNFSNLVPTVASAPFTFCLKNTGNTPLALTASTPTSFTGSAINPNDVTLNVNCGVGGAFTGAVSFTTTVGGLVTPQSFGASPLNDTTNNVLSCKATATLSDAVTASNVRLTPFNIDFVGTTVAS